jgi:hypothetical protein
LRPAEDKKEDVNRAKAFGFAVFHLDRKPDHRASSTLVSVSSATSFWITALFWWTE